MAVKLAFCGTGYISQIHAKAARKLPGAELVAVVNHRPESRADFARTFGIPRQYTTVEELLSDGDVDAISINTPNYLHAPQSIAALEAGVHVLVEKPMALDAKEAAEIVAASDRSGALLMVAHCWRFDQEALWVRQQLAEGAIGEVVRTKGYGVHVNWGPAGWFSQKQYAGGGALVDMGIHAIDTARFLLGDPQPLDVYAKVGTYYRDVDVDDTGLVIVNWENGTTSYFEAGWWQPHADGPEAATQLYGRRGLASLFPTYISLPNPAEERVDRVDPGFPHPRAVQCPQSMYDAQMAYFVTCIRAGQRPVPGGMEGLTNMRILDAAYQSSRSGQVVSLLDRS